MFVERFGSLTAVFADAGRLEDTSLHCFIGCLSSLHLERFCILWMVFEPLDATCGMLAPVRVVIGQLALTFWFWTKLIALPPLHVLAVPTVEKNPALVLISAVSELGERLSLSACATYSCCVNSHCLPLSPAPREMQRTGLGSADTLG